MEKSYSGQSSYRFIDRLLRLDGKVLMVVSPFMDEYYAKILTGIASRKKVKIITTGKGAGGSKVVAALSKGVGTGILVKIFFYFAALFAIVAYIGIWYAAEAIAAIGALAFLMMYIRFRNGTRNIEVRVLGGPFVHEKIYICGGEAITGSANLTYSGTHKNVEHIEMTDDPKSVSNLSKHFEELWESQQERA